PNANNTGVITAATRARRSSIKWGSRRRRRVRARSTMEGCESAVDSDVAMALDGDVVERRHLLDRDVQPNLSLADLGGVVHGDDDVVVVTEQMILPEHDVGDVAVAGIDEELVDVSGLGPVLGQDLVATADRALPLRDALVGAERERVDRRGEGLEVVHPGVEV